MFDFSGYPLPQMPADDLLMRILADQNRLSLLNTCSRPSTFPLFLILFIYRLFRAEDHEPREH
jgi:hypothetical protein